MGLHLELREFEITICHQRHTYARSALEFQKQSRTLKANNAVEGQLQRDC